MVIAIKRFFRKIVKIIKSPFAEKVLVIGDSHSEAFNAFSAYQLIVKLPKLQFQVCSVGGATALGLKNLNSHTQAAKKFKKAIQGFNGKRIFLVLGEVDIGFVIWLKAKEKNIPIKTTFDIAIHNYCNFISEIKNEFDLSVISTPLPTINEKNTQGEVASKRSSISISQKDRTELTLLFNSKIQSFCLTNKVNYRSPL
jgi:hypothetical protein